ncbi:MAG TPA: substrate-binding domain-containing protein [Pseudolysinimonas sp.]|jgi:rhamnose transport system substrate-binding protein
MFRNARRTSWTRSLAVAVAVTAAVGLAGCSTTAPTGGGTAPTSKTIVLIPKATGDPFFAAVRTGAEKAAKELGYTIDFVGPSTADAAGQVTAIENAIQTKPAAITIAPNDPSAVAPALKQAMKAGITVSTYNAEADTDAREFFINQADNLQVAQAITDTMADQVNQKGTFLLVTSTSTAANQITWVKQMQQYIPTKYPGMKIDQVIPGNDDPATVLSVTTSYLAAHPDTTGVWVIGGGMSGAIKAEQSLNIDPHKVPVAGLCIPSDVKDMVKSGLIKNCVLWDPADMGYTDVYAIDAKIKGTYPKSGNGTLKAGDKGSLKVVDNVVVAGKPLIFTADNIDQYNF